MIDKFFKALQKNRNAQSETEESADEPSTVVKKSSTPSKKFKDPHEKDKNSSDASSDPNNPEISKNSTQSNSKKIIAKRNSIPKVESKLLYLQRIPVYLMDLSFRIAISDCSLDAELLPSSFFTCKIFQNRNNQNHQ